MREFARTVSPAQVVSTFGSSFYVRSDSAAEYFLHPVFLRFLMLSLGIYTLMDQSDAAQLLVGWQLPMMWLATALTVIASLVVLGGLILRLYLRGVLRRIYTPFLVLPIVILAEITEQSVVHLLQAGDWKTLPDTLTDLTRNMMVVLLLDVMHVLYVVPTHPLAVPRTDGQAKETPADAPPQRATLVPFQPAIVATEPPESVEQLPEEAEAVESGIEGEIIRIADRTFAIGEIQSVRTEDHYLNVVTRTTRNMLRAKLSDLDLLHDGRHGVQINRSQWVSFAAIESVVDEENGQITLQMVNGDSATVSRTRRLVFMQLFNGHRTRQV